MTAMPEAPVVHLHPEAASVIAAAATAAYPNEACGLLIGSAGAAGWRISAAVAGANVHAEPHHRFEVDPRLVFAWMRKLRGGSDALIGHFHSHPDGPAEPSGTDRDSAFDRNALWLIAAVTAGQIGAMRAFRLGKGADPSFLELPVVGAPGPGAGTRA
jgi:proteasome lid subunit RPN8/RPN11